MTRLLRIVIVLSIAAGVFRNSALGQSRPVDLDNRPVIGVDLHVKVPTLLKKADKRFADRIKAEGSAKVAALGNQFLRFVRWRPIGVADEKSESARLVLTLQETTSIGGPNFVFCLGVEIGGKPYQTPELDPIVLYLWSDTRIGAGPTAVHRDALQRLETEFTKKDFQRKLVESFLRKIQLADKAFSSDRQKRVILPVRTAIVAAQPESIYKVEVTAVIPGESKDAGTMMLKHERASVLEPWLGLCQCVVTKLLYPPDAIDGWSDRIPVILAHNIQVQVFMWDYHLDPTSGTEGGMVTDIGG